MKRLLQISILLVLALALIVGLFQIGMGPELSSTGSTCRVGWNTRAGSCLALGTVPWLPGILPQVGWNS